MLAGFRMAVGIWGTWTRTAELGMYLISLYHGILCGSQPLPYLDAWLLAFSCRMSCRNMPKTPVLTQPAWWPEGVGPEAASLHEFILWYLEPEVCGGGGETRYEKWCQKLFCGSFPIIVHEVLRRESISYWCLSQNGSFLVSGAYLTMKAYHFKFMMHFNGNHAK